jgi:ribonucleotide monophosphatase NagD (HAD superfamily)
MMTPKDRAVHASFKAMLCAGVQVQYAQLCLNELPGCEFIATNRDAVTHLTSAQEWAGGNAMVGAVIGCTGREPTLVGKPSALMIDYLEFKFNIDKVKGAKGLVLMGCRGSKHVMCWLRLLCCAFLFPCGLPQSRVFLEASG